jgi:hypothetical protein
MIFALRAKEASSPVTRSSKRAPTAMIRSASSIAQLAGRVPCMPSMPSQRRSEAGNVPSAISVVVTGRSSRRARSVSCAEASACTTPPPAYSTGRRAAAIAAAALRSCLALGTTRVR